MDEATIKTWIAQATSDLRIKVRQLQGTSEGWHSATLLNGWVQETAFATPVTAYRRLASGLVVVKGIIKNGTIGLAAFNLPPGYRPAEDNHEFLSYSLPGPVFGRIDVSSNGDVVPAVGGTGRQTLEFSFVGEQ